MQPLLTLDLFVMLIELAFVSEAPAHDHSSIFSISGLLSPIDQT